MRGTEQMYENTVIYLTKMLWARCALTFSGMLFHTSHMGLELLLGGCGNVLIQLLVDSCVINAQELGH